MYTVTGRAKSTKQPRGGFLPIALFEKINFNDSLILGPENIHPGLVGLAVDYLTRYFLSGDKEGSFRIPLMGAANGGLLKKAHRLLNSISKLDALSITCACQLVGFDVLYRSPTAKYVPVETILPDDSTISNIRVMVNRTLRMLDTYGNITKVGFSFDGAYTDSISAGDGDYLSNTYLWDLKVSKTNPSSQDTLQLLIYYLMGKRSKHPEFQRMRYIAFLNPRLNCIHRLETNNIPTMVSTMVALDIIGYDDSATLQSSSPRRKKATRAKHSHLSFFSLGFLFIAFLLLWYIVSNMIF